MGQDHRRIGTANAAWCEEARLQVHADNGCLRSHQVTQVDRSNRLNDNRLPKQAMAAHSKLVDNANPDTTLLGLYFQQPARSLAWSDFPPRKRPSGMTAAQIVSNCGKRTQ